LKNFLSHLAKFFLQQKMVIKALKTIKIEIKNIFNVVKSNHYYLDEFGQNKSLQLKALEKVEDFIQC